MHLLIYAIIVKPLSLSIYLFATKGRTLKIQNFQLYAIKLKADHKDGISRPLLYLLEK